MGSDCGQQPATYDALVVVSFGGPERREDVMPFLENVLRGRSVPPERLAEVVRHYEYFEGVSPLNEQIRALLAALLTELNTYGPRLAVYWGNRNWHPLLEDTVREMAEDGVRRALAFVTSAFASYSGCRQYLDDIERARRSAGPEAPGIDKLRLFFNHPGFIEALADRVRSALEAVPHQRRQHVPLLYTAHSLPLAVARQSKYVEQLQEACRLVSHHLGRSQWQLAFQSRSGPPQQPWLEPDVNQAVTDLVRSRRPEEVLVVPIGFVCEHMEVAYDLDVELAHTCESLGVGYLRAATVGTHPRFIRMIRELIEERMNPEAPRAALGLLGPAPDVCPNTCCAAPQAP